MSRPTDLGFRDPRQNTPGYYVGPAYNSPTRSRWTKKVIPRARPKQQADCQAQSTSQEVPLTTFGAQERFNEYRVLAARTGHRVAPGSYEDAQKLSIAYKAAVSPRSTVYAPITRQAPPGMEVIYVGHSLLPIGDMTHASSPSSARARSPSNSLRAPSAMDSFRDLRSMYPALLASLQPLKEVKSPGLTYFVPADFDYDEELMTLKTSDADRTSHATDSQGLLSPPSHRPSSSRQTTRSPTRSTEPIRHTITQLLADLSPITSHSEDHTSSSQEAAPDTSPPVRRSRPESVVSFADTVGVRPRSAPASHRSPRHPRLKKRNGPVAAYDADLQQQQTHPPTPPAVEVTAEQQAVNRLSQLNYASHEPYPQQLERPSTRLYRAMGVRMEPAFEQSLTFEQLQQIILNNIDRSPDPSQQKNGQVKTTATRPRSANVSASSKARSVRRSFS